MNEALQLIESWFDQGPALAFGSVGLYSRETPRDAATGDLPPRTKALAARDKLLSDFKATTNKVAILCSQHGIEFDPLIKAIGSLTIDIANGAVVGLSIEEFDECWYVVKKLDIALRSSTLAEDAQEESANISRTSNELQFENDNARELYRRIQSAEGTGRSRSEIAREITGEPKGRQPRAESLLASVRRTLSKNKPPEQ